MKALIYGNGVSGKGAKKLLDENNIECQFVDDNSDEAVLNDASMLVLSPSITLSKPLVLKAQTLGIEVIGEIELAYRYNKGNIIAITGTNGKTTTSMMMDSVLREAGKIRHLCGNIGNSFAGKIVKIKENDTVVLEVSSFQLETIENFKPHIAMLLNLGVDHIERHGSFEAYARTKSDIFVNMDANDFAVLNYDDELVKEYTKNIRANKYYFSLNTKVKGAYIQDRCIYFQNERLFLAKEIHALGEHNMKNALATIVAAKLMNIPNIAILRALRSFALPPHRIQFIGRYHHKNYYNDSKATNIEATISAVKSLKGSITLIIGGYDKGISYHELFESFDKNVRSVIIFGQNKGKIEKAIADFDLRYFVEPTLLKAIERASRERVDNVLFSPGTSSYDMFTNYEERGDMFIKLVGDINED